MKKFVKYICILFALTLALMFVFDSSYTYAFKTGTPRSKLDHMLQQSNTTYDYLFLGSSRTEFHIDCNLIEELTGKSCINYGISGTTFKDTYAMLELMEARGIQFNNVFVQVDYMYNDLGYSNLFRARLFAHQGDSIVKKVLKKYDVSFADKYVPFYRFIMNDHEIGFREVFSLFTGIGSKADLENGFIPLFGTNDYTIESLPNTIIDSNPSIDAMTAYFEEQKIHSFFFTAPICDNTVDRDVYVQLLKTKIPTLYDYVSLYDGNKNDFYFDCGHLNKSGATDFTQRLTNDLILN